MSGRTSELERLAREAGGDWLAVARLARLLALAARAELVLDVGAGPGVVSLWLADAVAETGGHLIVLEREPAAIERLTVQLKALGLAERVQVLQGDAHRTIRTVAGTIDFVRLAADRAGYVDYPQAVRHRLRRGGVLLAEGLRRPETDAFRRVVEDDDRFAAVEVPFCGGCLVAVWWPGERATL
ncbi:class I SAM-dependent methyltransferase [Thermomicrobium sp. 4228-Ro]|uniref:O-methyltransferase n=1 Tax=Thermomicrobium sp. 4228-Ro TaxID=2993937 RepID=UPI0022489012|nr:methyltransferase domain-containing protein [Thermomicrobium sp. 4228-Ro]MCX2727782.1 class I SAM-dependent methyltransferase [Thermomicrobium sp. 4228-Ro]